MVFNASISQRIVVRIAGLVSRARTALCLLLLDEYSRYVATRGIFLK